MDTSFTFVFPNLKSQTFLSNGTFTVPKGVFQLLIVGCGGGGGGGARVSNASVGNVGLAAPLGIRSLAVSPGSTFNVSIGAGGNGLRGGTVPTFPTDGQPSYFGTQIFYGGGTMWPLSNKIFASPQNGPFGAGGNPVLAEAGNYSQINAEANSGAGGSYGGSDGGNGGSGRIIVFWTESA